MDGPDDKLPVVPTSDPLADASTTVAWVIALNKPVYPLYVWYLAPDALKGSLATILTMPLFLAVPWLLRRSPYHAKVAMVLAGLADTAFETKYFGPATGTEAFFAACALLAIVSFNAAEVWTRRVLVGLSFACFVLLHGRYGTPILDIDAAGAERLFSLNVVAAASLMAFIGFRYPAAKAG
jgi:hypothetical protein